METKKSTGTPYDDAFRVLITGPKDLVIPFINELFETAFEAKDENITIEHSINEMFIQRGGGDLSKRVTDSCIVLRNARLYSNTIFHIECQSSPDGTMFLRMFQYDSQIALRDCILENNELRVRFPESAVLYLRSNNNTPDRMKITIETPGGECSYYSRVMKIKSYTIDEMFRKRLYFLIPFYIFLHEAKLPEYNINEQERHKLASEYEGIIKRLNEDLIAGYLSEHAYQTVCETLKNVLDNLVDDYPVIREEVEAVMGAHQLYFPERQIYDQGHNAGISEGIAIGRAQTEAKLATAQQALYNTYVSLRKDGIPKSKALRYTGLSKELALKAEDELAQ